MVLSPRLLRLENYTLYRQHFINTYCRNVINTHDGIRVFFRENSFSHAFYESTNRNGVKDAFSWVRAQRIDWIAATLADPSTTRYQGWISKKRRYDPARSVDLLFENFVVIVGFYLSKNGQLRGNFITCFQADNSVTQIQKAPLWTREACLDALNRTKDGR